MSTSMLKGVHRRALGISKDEQVMAPHGFVSGGDGKPSIVQEAPDTTAVFEDFHGDDITGDDTGKPLYGGPLRGLVGDTGVGGASTQDKQAGTNGVHRLFATRGASASNRAAAGGLGLGTGSLDWKGNQGPGAQAGRLRMGARVKMGTVERTEAAGSNRMHVFVGFTDVATYEFPTYDTGAGIISNASDAVGVMFSPGGDTGWFGVGVRGDTDVGPVVLDTGPTANVYDTVEVEVHRGISDTGGTATFYINGQPAGSLTSPITSNVALQPVVMAWLQDTGDNYLDVDWVNVSAPRDSGL